MAIIFQDQRHQRTSQFSVPSKTVLVPTAHAKPFSEAAESHGAGGTLKRTQVSQKLRSPSRLFCWYCSATSHFSLCTASSGQCNTTAESRNGNPVQSAPVPKPDHQPSSYLSLRVKLPNSICKSSPSVTCSFPASHRPNEHRDLGVQQPLSRRKLGRRETLNLKPSQLLVIFAHFQTCQRVSTFMSSLQPPLYLYHISITHNHISLSSPIVLPNLGELSAEGTQGQITCQHDR